MGLALGLRRRLDPVADLDLGPVLKLKRAVDDHALARIQAGLDHGQVPLDPVELDVTLRNREIGIDDEGVMPRLTGLHRLSRRDDPIALGGERHLHVRELPRHQSTRGIRELRLEAKGAGRGIHGVIHEDHLARHRLTATRSRLHPDRRLGLVAADAIDLVLGDGEADEDRRDAVDHEQRSGAARGDEVADVDLAIARHPVDRRDDRRIRKLHARVLHHGQIRLHRRFERSHARRHLLGLLTRDEALGQQLLVTPCIGLGLRQLGAIARQGRLGLLHGGLQRSGIQLEEHLPLLHRLPFLEAQFQHLPRRLGANRNRLHRLDRTDRR
ncbi:hypothetical protein D3C86_352410 [compost metagenome]